MIPVDKITNIYFIVDEFLKEFDKTIKEHSLSESENYRKRNRKFTMSQSEVMTILILFHISSVKNLKAFYKDYVQKHLNNEFPNTVSYNRFVELQKKTSVALAVFVKMMCLGKCTGISFIDSTPLRSCHIKRENQHKTFKDIAQKGQCSLGWFYGLIL